MNGGEFVSIVLVIGIIAGVVFLTLRGKSSGVGRFYLLGALSILLGIGLSVGGLSQAYRLALYFGPFGFALLISGALVLHRYLNENLIPADAERQNE